MAAERQSYDGFIPQQSYANMQAVTPSDTALLNAHSKMIYVGNAGNLNVRMLGGVSGVFVAAAGALLPLRCDLVFSTSTTCSGIVALW